MSFYKFFFQAVEVVLSFAIIIFLVSLWTQEIYIDKDIIPTILNGLVSSVSLIVSFTGACITLTLTKTLFDVGKHRKRVICSVVMLLFPIILVFSTYEALMGGDYYKAFKYAFSGLGIALTTLLDFIMFLVCVE